MSISAIAGSQTATSGNQSEGAVASSAAESLKVLDQLVQQNQQLEKQNRELMDQIASLRRVLAEQSGLPQEKAEKKEAAKADDKPMVPDDSQEGAEKPAPVTAVVETPKKWGSYTPNLGFKVAQTDYGDMSIGIFSYVRYLNQLGLSPTYTNAFGITSAVQQRHEFELQKMQIKFMGWVGTPRLRYFLYAWSSNANMGQGAQVVLAGNLNYKFSNALILSGGINGLPGTRSIEGNFPYWLSEDSRLIADEFFRASYTSGVWARGDLGKKFKYHLMLGNNMSQLGVNAGQLVTGPKTMASALIWHPTTGEYGAGFGDFENHQTLASRLAIHYSHSLADKQSQPNTEAFQNTQIRLSDGSIVFTPNLFGPGVQVNKVNYDMIAMDGGIKKKGIELWAEGYMRWLSNWQGVNTSGLKTMFDDGFSGQLSAMLKPQLFQVYTGGSVIYGNYGTPYDFRFGTNYFPFRNRVLRWNNEALYLNRSPVGYLAVPFNVGGTGWVYHSNLELAF